MMRQYFLIPATVAVVLLKFCSAEEQKHFNVSESAPEGHLIGYINDTLSYGTYPNYLVVFSDDTKNTKNVCFHFLLLISFTHIIFALYLKKKKSE